MEAAKERSALPGEGWLDTPWRSGSWRFGGVALVVLCLAVYLPGLFTIPPIDRDESRFAQASRRMFESGDYVVPRVQAGAAPRLNKPPLIYWLQCASVGVFGDPASPPPPSTPGLGNIWVFRIPSVLCAIGAVLVTWRLGCRMFDPRVAWLGAAFLAVCPMVAWDAHQARADQLLLFCTVAAQACLFIAWRRAADAEAAKPGWLPMLGFWLMTGLGILAKGPITPMVAGLTIFAMCLLSRRWRWVLALRPLLGLIIIAALVGPWVYLVGERVGWRGEHGYLATVYNETIGRSVNSRGAEGHWGPPGYHLVLLVVLMWPGSMLTALGLRWAWMRSGLTASRRRGLRALREDEPALFLLAWIVPSWIVFELVSTKLPHYTMPLYPALCLLSARAVYAAEVGKLAGLHDRLTRIGLWIWSIFAVPLSILTLGWVMDWQRGRYVRASHYAILGVVATCIVLFELFVPRFTSASPTIMAALRAIDPEGKRPVAAMGYEEDSLVFLRRGELDRLGTKPLGGNAQAAQAWLAAHPDGIIAAEPDELLGYFRKPLSDQTGSAWGMRRIEGMGTLHVFNYSKGRTAEIGFYESNNR